MCKDKLATLRRIQAHLIIGEGCWEWSQHRNKDRYGTITVWDESRTRYSGRLVSRVLWEIVQGPIPEGLNVLHRCDNPPCARADHLFLGTQGTNVRDATIKGRNRGYKWNPEKIRRGEAHSSAKLTEVSVIEIKRRLAAGDLGYRLATEFGVSDALISRIKVGRAWTHL